MLYCGCGGEAYHMCRMNNIPNPFPICVDCMHENDWKAQEVNDHEMRNFGGAYGLVSYEYIPITYHPCEELIPIEYYMEN